MNNTEKILAKALLEEIQKINSKIETYKKLDLSLDKLLEIKGAYYTIGEKVLNLPIDAWYEGRKELETIANS